VVCRTDVRVPSPYSTVRKLGQDRAYREAKESEHETQEISPPHRECPKKDATVNYPTCMSSQSPRKGEESIVNEEESATTQIAARYC
jgi:hypothetical protein